MKNLQPLEIDQSLTPWNIEDNVGETPAISRIKTNPYATKYYKKRNTSQSMKNIDRSSKRHYTC